MTSFKLKSVVLCGYVEERTVHTEVSVLLVVAGIEVLFDSAPADRKEVTSYRAVLTLGDAIGDGVSSCRQCDTSLHMWMPS